MMLLVSSHNQGVGRTTYSINTAGADTKAKGRFNSKTKITSNSNSMLPPLTYADDDGYASDFEFEMQACDVEDGINRERKGLRFEVEKSNGDDEEEWNDDDDWDKEDWE